jgi:hypothetical protein
LEDAENVEPELQTLQQQGAAITMGMISIAVGLACAENFLYIFFLGGTQDNIEDMSVHLMILLFQSMSYEVGISHVLQPPQQLDHFQKACVACCFCWRVVV